MAASDDSTSVEAARADLDALYKGDYRNAFEQKNPDLFLRHISDVACDRPSRLWGEW